MNQTDLTWKYIVGPQQGFENPTYGQLGVASATANPGARGYAAYWIDNQDNMWILEEQQLVVSIVLYGLNQVDDNYQDIWRYNGNWTWMEGQKDKNLGEILLIFGKIPTAISGCLGELLSIPKI